MADKNKLKNKLIEKINDPKVVRIALNVMFEKDNYRDVYEFVFGPADGKGTFVLDAVWSLGGRVDIDSDMKDQVLVLDDMVEFCGTSDCFRVDIRTQTDELTLEFEKVDEVF